MDLGDRFRVRPQGFELAARDTGDTAGLDKVVFQAMDAAGKDSTIEHVMGRLNPQGVHVKSFKQPTSPELEHDWLWRCRLALTGRRTKNH